MSDMADVIRIHSQIGRDEKGQYCKGCQYRYGYAAERKLHWDASKHVADALSAAGFGPVNEARAGALEALVADSPRLPSDVRGAVFDAVFDVVEKFNFPAQNMGPHKDVVEIGDVCGEVEKRIVALLRARAAAERGGE